MHWEFRHWQIITDILKKYPYTFYAFGSRVSGTAKQFSDLDLCFFGGISGSEYVRIEEDFECSDLPYKVDLVDWDKCDVTFRKIIRNNMICIQASDKLLKLEAMRINHFTYLPNLLGFSVTRNAEFTIVNCGLGTSEHNIVCDVKLKEKDCELRIRKIIDEFHGQEFSWWVGPSSRPLDLSQKLVSSGLQKHSVEYLMIYDSKNRSKKLKENERLNIKKVEKLQELNDFIKVVGSKEKSTKNFYGKMNLEALRGQEMLFVGYENDKPIESGKLFCDNEITGIFSLYNLNEIQGNRCTENMLNCLINKVPTKYIALSVSSDFDLKYYSEFGFKVIGQVECFIGKK